MIDEVIIRIAETEDDSYADLEQGSDTAPAVTEDAKALDPNLLSALLKVYQRNPDPNYPTWQIYPYFDIVQKEYLKRQESEELNLQRRMKFQQSTIRTETGEEDVEASAQLRYDNWKDYTVKHANFYMKTYLEWLERTPYTVDVNFDAPQIEPEFAPGTYATEQQGVIPDGRRVQGIVDPKVIYSGVLKRTGTTLDENIKFTIPLRWHFGRPPSHSYIVKVGTLGITPSVELDEKTQKTLGMPILRMTSDKLFTFIKVAASAAWDTYIWKYKTEGVDQLKGVILKFFEGSGLFKNVNIEDVQLRYSGEPVKGANFDAFPDNAFWFLITGSLGPELGVVKDKNIPFTYKVRFDMEHLYRWSKPEYLIDDIQKSKLVPAYGELDVPGVGNWKVLPQDVHSVLSKELTEKSKPYINKSEILAQLDTDKELFEELKKRNNDIKQFISSNKDTDAFTQAIATYKIKFPDLSDEDLAYRYAATMIDSPKEDVSQEVTEPEDIKSLKSRIIDELVTESITRRSSNSCTIKTGEDDNIQPELPLEETSAPLTFDDMPIGVIKDKYDEIMKTQGSVFGRQFLDSLRTYWEGIKNQPKSLGKKTRADDIEEFLSDKGVEYISPTIPTAVEKTPEQLELPTLEKEIGVPNLVDECRKSNNPGKCLLERIEQSPTPELIQALGDYTDNVHVVKFMLDSIAEKRYISPFLTFLANTDKDYVMNRLVDLYRQTPDTDENFLRQLVRTVLSMSGGQEKLRDLQKILQED